MKNILIVSDSILSTSGVGTQTKYLIEGLSNKNKYNFYQLGASRKDENEVNTSIAKVYPTKGFASFNKVYEFVIEKRIDLIIIFTDPRFFEGIFENNKLIRKLCPIVYWHVWDNNPTPEFNRYIYESVDVINCHSYLTYENCVKMGYKNKTNFSPHTIPENIFFRLSDSEKENYKVDILGKENKDKFVLLWINKNIKRKRAADLLFAWKKFADSVDNNCMLIMHTNPFENSGYNIKEIVEHLDLSQTTKLSIDKVSEDVLNILYNISNASINISHAEGFGLNILQGMMCGTPPIGLITGGIKRQLIDYRDESLNGIPIYPDVSVINGNQSVPFIYEDFASHENISNAIYKMYNINSEDYKNLSLKAMNYAKNCFNYNNEINNWEKIIDKAIENHSNYMRYEVDFI